jgi:hypothetical protein
MKAENIRKAVFERFSQKSSIGFCIHDRDLRRWAVQINRKLEHPLDGFVASESWAHKFKKRFNLVSRKITKYVTKSDMTNKAEIEANARAFVQEIKQELQQYQPHEVWNIDQSGFQREMHTGF